MAVASKSRTQVARPIRDRLIVEPIESSDTTPGGIVLPDNAREKSQRGKVLAVGSGRILSDGNSLKMEVAEGDLVLYAKYGGTEIEIDGDKLVILREDDVLAIL